MTHLHPDLLTSKRSIQSDAVRPAGKRVVVLYEPGRSGSAALALARRLVGDDGSALTVVTVAPQDTRICCGAGSAIDYNRGVCETADAELREARELLGPVGDRASFKLLVQDKHPPLAAWIAVGDFDVVLLPARRRPGAARSTRQPISCADRPAPRSASSMLDRASRSRPSRSSGRHWRVRIPGRQRPP